MSRVLEDRVWAAHPLGPAHRMVLLTIAREVTDGQTEALINRAALARRLDASADVVRHALTAGEQIGVCRVLKSTGRIAFDAYDGLIGVEPSPVKPPDAIPAVRTAPHDEKPAVDHLTSREFMGLFARAWGAQYRQTYYVQTRDWKMAQKLAQQIPSADVPRYITNYLTHADQFYRSCMHSFGMFYDKINAFGASPMREPSRVPDAEQTQEYLSTLKQIRTEAKSDHSRTTGGGPERA
jgi:hypothetical protein